MEENKCKKCVFYKNEEQYNAFCELMGNRFIEEKPCEMFREPMGITVMEQLGDKTKEVIKKAKEKGVTEENIKKFLNKDSAEILWCK